MSQSRTKKTSAAPLETLTTENAHRAQLIAHKTEEWGNKAFFYQSEFNKASSIGRGSDSRIIGIDEFQEWVIVRAA